MPFGQDTDDKGARTKKANNRDATIRAYIADLKARPQMPDSAKEHDYAERFKKSYPFHPSLLDILNLVGANPKLQRTRGVLRVLALVVADLLKKNHNGGLIQSSDIDLTNGGFGPSCSNSSTASSAPRSRPTSSARPPTPLSSTSKPR